MTLQQYLYPGDFTIDRKSGTVTLKVPPPDGSTVSIGWRYACIAADFDMVVVLTFHRPWLAWWDRWLYRMRLLCTW